MVQKRKEMRSSKTNKQKTEREIYLEQFHCESEEKEKTGADEDRLLDSIMRRFQNCLIASDFSVKYEVCCQLENKGES